MSSTPQEIPAGEEHIYLISRSSLSDYISFMTSFPVNAADVNRKQLTDEWMIADRVMRELRETEADWADVGVGGVRPLPKSLQPLTSRVLEDPIFLRAFEDVTYEFAMVDLERVIVSQKLVSLQHIRRLQNDLGTNPSPVDVFRFCLPFDRVPPKFRASRVGDEEFAFTSDSSDLRFLDTVLLRPDQITGYRPVGPIAGVVALVVGFGANYLHVLATNDRLVLNNGHHRACALYAQGLRQVPCVVQTITHPDELEVHAPRAVRRNQEFYLSEPRPPVVPDYFHSSLARTIPLALTTKQVLVRYSYEEQDMP